VINRGLVRRLEELETRLAPVSVPLRIHVKYIDDQGNVVSSHVVEGPTFRAPLPARRWNSTGRKYRAQLAAGGI